MGGMGSWGVRLTQEVNKTNQQKTDGHSWGLGQAKARVYFVGEGERKDGDQGMEI